MSEPSTRTESDTNNDQKPTRTLGLVPSPGYCERVAEDIVNDLEKQLAQVIDGDVTWNIEIVPDPLTGSNVSMSEVLEEVSARKSRNSWDYAVSLIDVPTRRENRIVIGETGRGLDVAVICVPSLGVIRLRRRVLTMLLEMMDDLHRGTASRDEPARFIDTDEAHRFVYEDEETGGDLRYTTPAVKGHIQLLVGMVYANRPWRLFPSFKTTVATAFATGGYALIFTTLWEIGNVYSYPRLTTLMLVAMSVLSMWIIVSHDLWEKPRDDVTRYVRTLYNTTTLLTIAAGVMFSYTVIFTLLLLAATVYIPEAMLESTIGQPVSPINYVKVAWVASSVATIAGAIGAGLEDSEEVRNATFGWRQRNRWKEYSEESGE